MSQPASPNLPPPPPAATFPYWWDYLCMFLGCAISLALARYTRLHVSRTDATPDWLPNALVEELPRLLLLPVGLYLWWPVFFLLGRLRGRAPHLSPAEWVWGVVWLLDLALIGVLFWLHGGEVPERAAEYINPQSVREHVETILRWLALGLAGLAVVLAVLTRLSGAARSWTHHFALALMLWPMVPVGLIVGCGLGVAF